MKVLKSIKYYEPSKGGIESVAKNLIEGVNLVKPDINFTVYCNNHELKNKIKIETYRSNLQIIRSPTPIFIKSQPISFNFSNFSKYLADNDIIHHHYPYPTMELSLLKNSKILKSKKLIVTWHANIENSRWAFIKNIYDPMIKRLLNYANHIVITSPQIFEYSNVLKDYEKKIRIIPLSFTPKIKISPKSKVLNKPVKLLFVGKLREYKGLRYLIEAMKLVENAELNIIGTGEEKDYLLELTKKLSLNNRINFLGYVSDDQLESYYQNSNLFILPSINEAEAFGVVQLEALSHGIPVINTSLKSGVPFVSKHNETGITVPPANTIKLAQAINKIIGDPILYSSLSKNCYERAKKFSNDKMVQSYLDLYND